MAEKGRSVNKALCRVCALEAATSTVDAPPDHSPGDDVLAGAGGDGDGRVGLMVGAVGLCSSC